MSKFDDYDVLSNLGSDSCFYKVKNKTTAEICIWRAIDVAAYSDQELKLLSKTINDEKQYKHNNTVQVFSYILNVKTLYIVTKYYKYGNLKNVIEFCIKRNEILSETFLWRLLYNIICVLKLKGRHGFISLETIFMDADFVAKVYYLDIVTKPCSITKCLSSVGTILLQLCNLQTKPTKIKFPIVIPNHYSNHLFNMITLLLKDTKKINFDYILCHPIVLLKSANQNEVFIKASTENRFHSCQCELLLENLEIKEAALKSLEEKLNEKELMLRKREKMLIIMERSYKEKLREVKKNTVIRRKTTVYEDLDTTLSAAECDESVILPTSTRMNLNSLKNTNFSRSLSERRIRFKGHSPLKNICNIGHNEKIPTTDNTKCRKNIKFIKTIKKELKEDDKMQLRSECRPISWTDEAKRQAFGMLRIMNAIEPSQEIVEVKHTHL